MSNIAWLLGIAMGERHMQHHHRITLWLIVLGFVVGCQQGAQAQSPEKLVFAYHVTISPSWFDPAETPAG